MHPLKALLLASRPRTWIASLSPVLLGTAFAAKEQPIDLFLFSLTAFFSLLIQIGTNFANDYFDFIKGADTAARKGPPRATQQGWISPLAMLRATFIIFSIAFAIAIPLMIRAGWQWSLPLAILSILFGILYTGGPKPLGYMGLGELLVLIFFGPIATCGTYFLQTLSMHPLVFFGGLAPGFLSCSLLIANNLRDEESDRVAKKQTLVVRWGTRWGQWEYLFSLVAASSIPLILVFFYTAPKSLLSASLIFPLSFPLVKKAFFFKDPLELISVLQGSAGLLFLYTAFFCIALLW